MGKEYKYPYIPKEYFPAVMFACRMVREGTGRNIACQRAADYYGVDEDEVSRHLAKRAGAGHKGVTKRPATWYVWFDHRAMPGPFHCWSRSRFDKVYGGWNEDLHKIIAAEFNDKKMALAFCAELNAGHEPDPADYGGRGPSKAW